MMTTAESLQTEINTNLASTFCIEINKEPMQTETLTEGELANFTKWNHPKRQQHWLMGRGALKQVLKKLDQNLDTSSLLFPNTHYSLTHSDTIAIAIGASPNSEIKGLGIDFEAHRLIKDRALKFYLSPEEQLLLSSVDCNENRLRLWTVKEALFKANINNTDTLYLDYQIKDVASLIAEASCEKTQSLFKYASIPFESGYITVAYAK